MDFLFFAWESKEEEKQKLTPVKLRRLKVEGPHERRPDQRHERLPRVPHAEPRPRVHERRVGVEQQRPRTPPVPGPVGGPRPVDPEGVADPSQGQPEHGGRPHVGVGLRAGERDLAGGPPRARVQEAERDRGRRRGPEGKVDPLAAAGAGGRRRHLRGPEGRGGSRGDDFEV